MNVLGIDGTKGATVTRLPGLGGWSRKSNAPELLPPVLILSAKSSARDQNFCASAVHPS
jgi:hypothetical protein